MSEDTPLLAADPMDDAAEHSKRERVSQACETCRTKKTKCDGGMPCNRCMRDNRVCTHARSRKVPKRTTDGLQRHMATLERQNLYLLRVVEALYSLAEQNETWPGKSARGRADGRLCLNTILTNLELYDIPYEEMSFPWLTADSYAQSKRTWNESDTEEATTHDAKRGKTDSSPQANLETNNGEARMQESSPINELAETSPSIAPFASSSSFAAEGSQGFQLNLPPIDAGATDGLSETNSSAFISSPILSFQMPLLYPVDRPFLMDATQVNTGFQTWPHSWEDDILSGSSFGGEDWSQWGHGGAGKFYDVIDWASMAEYGPCN